MTFSSPVGFSATENGPVLTPTVIAALKESMIRGIKAEGSFPVSERLIQKLSVVLGERDPLINDLIQLILSDPVLALRLVSLSNFPAYSRGRPAMSVTSAVQQFGFRRITEIIRGLSPNRDFSKAYQERSLSVHLQSRLMSCVTIATHLAKTLSPKKSLTEEVMILCVAAALPELLCAHYLPHVFAATWFDAATSKTEFPKSFRKVFLQSINECAQELASGLSMPKEYGGMLNLLEIPPWNKRSWGPDDGEDQKVLSKSVYAAQVIANELFQFSDRGVVQKLISEISGKIQVDLEELEQAVGEIPAGLKNFCELNGFPVIRVPPYALELEKKYNEETADSDGGSKRTVADRPKADRLVPFLGDLKSTFTDELEPSEIGQLDRAVLVTLLALVEALDFDKAVLIVPDSASGLLKVKAWVGLESLGLNNYRRKVAVAKYDFKPELQAFHEGRAIFNGDPLFGEDWPLAAFPVVRDGKSEAIFYADRASNPMAQPLDTAEQVAIVALAEAWQKLPSGFK